MPQFKCSECGEEFQAPHRYAKGKIHREISAGFDDNPCAGVFKPTRPVPHTHGCFRCDGDQDCYEEECDEEYGISECYECEEERFAAPARNEATLIHASITFTRVDMQIGDNKDSTDDLSQIFMLLEKENDGAVNSNQNFEEIKQ